MSACPSCGRRMPAPKPDARLATSSSLGCFRTCPRKYRLAYVDGLRARVEAPPLRFGSLWHDALAAWWQARAWAVEGADPYDYAKAQALLAGYGARWSLDGFEVLAIEQAFRAPLRDSQGRAVRGWALAGKVDGIVRYDNRTLLLEHKTTSDDITPGGDYWARLRIDTQISVYFDGAAALGHQVDACLYDVVRKPQLRPGLATPEDKRRITKKGTLDARQRDHDETPEEYQARVLEAIAENPNAYYARAEVVRLAGELDAARDDIVATVRSIEWSTKRDHWPRNDHACFDLGRCTYWPICSGQGSADDYQHVTDLHPELQEST